ncbi:hypothetical protein CLV35_0016 [Motilibacter peucedani]|uniref:Uncharacterized protein n=1 Tax=Motilibacter peucedani TaxID=598650 RepID=A0A420XVF7_9ACTN|nr:GNAT family N-acetyltransferase [Motilibacter peucedani]RKS84200.1 hypothetical protein CLV35_0016 [Motilibacter peucedani]
MSEQSQPSVVDAPEAHRYELRLGDEVAGYAAYELDGSTMVITHTVVEPAHEGQGLGSTLAHDALTDARRRGLEVVAQCPFVSAYVERHQEFADLVVER